jgi:ATP-binding cassette subfamily F protein 3
VLISEANFLLLDEPTNHLDIPSIQILMKALQNYQGTYIVISHDRHFLSCVANKIWYIEDKQLKEYPGTYHEYEEMQSRKAEAEKLRFDEEKQKQKEQKKAKVEEKKPKVEEKIPVSFEEQKQRKNRLRKMEKEQEDIEADIERMEKEKKNLLNSLVETSVAANFHKIAEVQKKIDNLTAQIAKTTEKWEKIVAEVEEMQKTL